MTLPGASYGLLPSDLTCTRITSLSECSVAAVSLGLSDTTAVDYNPPAYEQDDYPPHCYLRSGALYFNSDGLNTGPCNTNEKCICQVGMYFVHANIL